MPKGGWPQVNVQHSSKAVAALLLGIVSLLTAGPSRSFSVVAAGVGLVLGIIGLSSPKRRMAIVGLVLCGLTLLGTLGLVLMVMTGP